MKTRSTLASAGALLLLAGCVSMPSGPGVMVLPGTGKSFEQFRGDDMECRQFANNQVGGSTPDSAAESSGLKSAAVGAAVGAAAGAVIGGRSGAATGAGTGLIVGSAAGAGAASGSQRNLQQRYDFGYQQCMYAKGHRIPTSGRFESGSSSTRPVSSYTPPPPPPGAPPPPPPGVK